MSNQGILVCGEINDGKLASITLELLGAGKKLAGELGQSLSLLLMTDKIGNLAQDAIAHGVDTVYVAENSILGTYNPDAFSDTTTNRWQKIHPEIILLGQTDIGRDMAPRLVAKLQGGLAMDCIDLTIDPNTKLLIQILF